MTVDELNHLKYGDKVRALVQISDVRCIYAHAGDIGACVADGDGTVIVLWPHWPRLDCRTQAHEIEPIATAPVDARSGLQVKAAARLMPDGVPLCTSRAERSGQRRDAPDPGGEHV